MELFSFMSLSYCFDMKCLQTKAAQEALSEKEFEQALKLRGRSVTLWSWLWVPVWLCFVLMVWFACRVFLSFVKIVAVAYEAVVGKKLALIIGHPLTQKLTLLLLSR